MSAGFRIGRWSALLIGVLLAATCGGGETSTESSSTTGQQPSGSLVLRGDGLGIVDFGLPADDVTRTLEQLIGSPPTDPWAEAEWIQFIGWSDHGLYVGFDTPMYSEYEDVSRFRGWQYNGPADGMEIRTAEGAGVGTTVAELRALYGDRLQIPTEPDECTGDWTYRITSPSGEAQLHGALDQPSADQARIVTMHAGLGVGC